LTGTPEPHGKEMKERGVRCELRIMNRGERITASAFGDKHLKRSTSRPSKGRGKMGLLENGTALVENLIPIGLVTVASKLVEAPRDLAATVATRLVEAIAINSISEKVRRGRTVVVKRRNLHSEQLADLTNLYFRMADIPIRFWSKVNDWQRWEIDC